MRRATPLLLLLLALAGCNATLLPRVEVGDTKPIEPPERTPTQLASASNGAIFQSATYRPLFEDHRARLVGDTITIRIEEKITASQSSTSKIDKSGSVDASISALPGVPTQGFTRAAATGSSANNFEGKGKTETANDFTGSITGTVARVLPNGHLIVTGEKQIGVNQNVDVLRFTGQIDPRSIQPGNTVSSTQIANVRLEQRGRGQQAESQVIGWLSRVFLSLLPI